MWVVIPSFFFFYYSASAQKKMWCKIWCTYCLLIYSVMILALEKQENESCYSLFVFKLTDIIKHQWSINAYIVVLFVVFSVRTNENSKKPPCTFARIKAVIGKWKDNTRRPIPLFLFEIHKRKIELKKRGGGGAHTKVFSMGSYQEHTN